MLVDVQLLVEYYIIKSADRVPIELSLVNKRIGNIANKHMLIEKLAYFGIGRALSIFIPLSLSQSLLFARKQFEV